MICKKCRQEIAKSFEGGIDWHYVRVECDCGTDQILVADKRGEDCRAYNLADELKGKCSTCNKNKIINVIELR